MNLKATSIPNLRQRVQATCLALLRFYARPADESTHRGGRSVELKEGSCALLTIHVARF